MQQPSHILSERCNNQALPLLLRPAVHSFPIMSWLDSGSSAMLAAVCHWHMTQLYWPPQGPSGPQGKLTTKPTLLRSILLSFERVIAVSLLR